MLDYMIMKVVFLLYSKNCSKELEYRIKMYHL